MTVCQHGKAAASKSDAKDCDVIPDNSAEDVFPQINLHCYIDHIVFLLLISVSLTGLRMHDKLRT